MKKWRLRKIKTFAWDHKDNQQWKEDSAFIDLFSESIKKMCMLHASFLLSIYPSSQPSIHLSIHPLTYSQQVSGSHIISLWWNRVQTQMSKPLPNGSALEQRVSNFLVSVSHCTLEHQQRPPEACVYVGCIYKIYHIRNENQEIWNIYVLIDWKTVTYILMKTYFTSTKNFVNWVALFYILANLFNVWLNWGWLNSHMCFCL